MRSRRLCLTHSLSHFVCECVCVSVSVCVFGARDEKTKRCANEDFAADEILGEIFKKIWIYNCLCCDVFPPVIRSTNENENQKQETKPQTDLSSSFPPSTIYTPTPAPQSLIEIRKCTSKFKTETTEEKHIEKTCINKEKVNDKNTTTITIATTTKKSISYSNHVAFHPLSAAVRGRSPIRYLGGQCRAGEHLQFLLLPKSTSDLQL